MIYTDHIEGQGVIELRDVLIRGIAFAGLDVPLLPIATVHFVDVDLRGVAWVGLRMNDVVFERVRIQEANLTDCVLERVEFRYSANSGSIDATGLNLTGATLDAVRMDHVMLAGARFDGASVSKSTLERCVATGTSFVGVTFSSRCTPFRRLRCSASRKAAERASSPLSLLRGRSARCSYFASRAWNEASVMEFPSRPGGASKVLCAAR